MTTQSIRVEDVISWAESIYKLIGTDMQPPDRIINIAMVIIETWDADNES